MWYKWKDVECDNNSPFLIWYSESGNSNDKKVLSGNAAIWTPESEMNLYGNGPGSICKASGGWYVSTTVSTSPL